MRPAARIGIVAALVLTVGIVMAAKQRFGPARSGEARPAARAPGESSPQSVAGLPRLLELGSVTCIPCKMMAPVLEELRQEYGDRLRVDFIDVWQDEEAAARYEVQFIPTQILFDASGREVFRHQGFFAKEDILAKWKELGIDLEQNASTAPSEQGAPPSANVQSS